MKYTYKIFNILIISLLYLFTITITLGQSNLLKQYEKVEDAGFSATALDKVKKQLDSLDTASLLVVYKGSVLFDYGESRRKFMLHSIRKSIMNAMIGIEVEKGTITLDQSLEALNIDDTGALTSEERQATVKDLLSARSGIYHPSAYAPEGMIEHMPDRGSHAPGSYWYYNNWDFNALLTIYEQQSGKAFFKAFKKEIADPIGMEDFLLEDSFYKIEKEKSVHPAYLFKMSAVDLARFGMLYLQKGKWNNQQIISADWIAKSTGVVSSDLEKFSQQEAYGLLWWVTEVDGRKMFYASGLGGHKLMIFPDDDLVMVHRVNTYENLHVSDYKVKEIAAEILAAKSIPNNEHPNPALTAYNPPRKAHKVMYKGSMNQYVGTYEHRFFGEMTIKRSLNGYVLENSIGNFSLFPISENTFLTADIELPLVLLNAPDEHKKFLIEIVLMKDKSMKEMIFYY